MIRPRASPTTRSVAHHYDELDPFYRALWGEHLHHGLWTTGLESPQSAALALVDHVARRADIRPGSRVCDVGCGYGATSSLLVARGARVTGLTVSAEQYRYANRAASGPRHEPGGDADSEHDLDRRPAFLLRDWLHNRLPDASFDAVIAIESLSHMDDPARAVREAFRVLRPGGRFVAAVWLAAEHPSPWEVRHLLRPVCEEGRLVGLPAPSDYGLWLGRAGFARPVLEDLTERVTRTWSISARRVTQAALRPSGWRYLFDRRNTERRFALSVLRILVAYRVGAMRYAVISGTRPAA